MEPLMTKAETQIAELSLERNSLPVQKPEPKVLQLSFAQQRLWFLYKLEPDSPAYNLAAAVRFFGLLDRASLKRSLHEIVQRHETLRTTFDEADGRPRPIIHLSAAISMSLHDLSELAAGERDVALEKLSSEEARLPFDLVRGPLLRCRLIRLGPEENVLLVSMHHIVSDGWSVGIFLGELADLYNAFSQGTSATLPRLAVQYTDFASWQHERLQGETLERQLAYWSRQLEAPPAVLDLPTDRPRSAIQTSRGKSESFLFPKTLSASLNALSRTEGCTLFMTLLAAFKVLLYRYTAQEDLLVGTPIANRSLVETEGLIGLFVNTLVLRTKLLGDPDFREVLRRVRETTLDALSHQDLPFEKLMEELHPARNLSHSPLFQVMFALQNAPGGTFELTDVRATILPLDNQTSKFDLTLSVEDAPGGLAGSCEYNSDLFDDTTIRRMLGHFKNLLEAIVADPDQPVATMRLLSCAEEETLLIEFNDTAQETWPDQCVHERFEAQVTETPDALAAIYQKQELTFAQLNERANRLACYLQTMGVGPDVLVGICLERSLEMLVGMLAVFKAGGAYMPMDPSYPKERLAFMLRDSGAPVVLTQQRLVSCLPLDDTKVLCLDGPRPEPWGDYQFPEGNPAGAATLANLAYVIYTSGSTGRPKGILIPHRGLANYLAWCTSAYEVEKGEGAPVHSSISFDLTITALFAPLLAGRAVELLAEAPGIESLSAALEEKRNYSLIKITPLHLELLRHQVGREQARGLTRRFVIGGENLLGKDLVFWQEAAPETVLVNEYGPSETVVGCCVHSVGVGEARTGSVPIGRPIANTQLYVVDKNLQAVPVGVPGELLVGGQGLAWGYLKRAELTAEKFIPSPFGMKPGERLYRTGDLVRHLPDGNLEYLGRIDHQVKIRGYRIELGEIEAVLREHPTVGEAVAVVRKDGPDNQRVVAYVTPQASRVPVPDELHGFLKGRLPHYMLPAALVVLDALPFNANGKVDHSRLPVPGLTARLESKNQIETPRSAAEMTLAEIWAQVLHLDRVGVHDNFFELGGDSILSLQVIARSNQAGLRFTPRQLFQHQTIAELATAAGGHLPVAAAQEPTPGAVVLTPIQRWFFEQELPNPHHWNQSLFLSVDPSLSFLDLERALQYAVLHHDALRMRFKQTATGWQQMMAAPGDTVPLARKDVSRLSEKKRMAAIENAALSLQASLNLGAGPILRAAYFDFGPGKRSRLLLIVHHLVVDAVSWRILVEDLETLCEQIGRGEIPQLPPKTSSFQQWAERLGQYATSEQLRNESHDWLAERRLPAPRLPVDQQKGPNTEASLRTVSVTLGEDDTRALLQELPKRFHTQINDALLAALGLAFRQWTGATSLLIDLEGHGRESLFEDIDLSRTVGWFTTLYPFQLNVDFRASDPIEGLRSVKRQRQRIHHGGIGYGLVRYLSGEPGLTDAFRGLSRPELIFNYLGQLDASLDGDRLLQPIVSNNVTDRSPAGHRNHLLEINAYVAKGRLNLDWSYSQNLHCEETVTNLADGCLEALRSLVVGCRSVLSDQPSPSDFALADLSQAELEAIVAKVCLAPGQASPKEVEDIYPLSATQQGLFFHGLCAPESGAYFEQLTAVLEGDLDLLAFERAWRQVVERQSIFRTAFFWEGLKDPVQVVLRCASLSVEQQDWRELSGEQQSERLESFLLADRARGFNLSQAPLARVALMRLAENRYQFTFSFHHLLLDGWSVPILFKEFFALYEGLYTGNDVQLEPGRPYRDYIAWLGRQDLSKLEIFWRQTLQGINAPTRLLTNPSASRLSGQEAAYQRQSIRLSETTTAGLQSLARKHHLTLNTLLLGSWSLVLSRYSGKDDVLCGVTVAGRPSALPGAENMLGLFINTLPLPIKIDREATMLSWCRQLQDQQAEWRQYEYSPLVKVHGWSEIPRSQSLFESIFVFENYPVDDSFLALTTCLTVRDVRFVDQASYPLSVLVVPGSEMLLGMGYDSVRIEAAVVTRMLDDFRSLLEHLIQEPDQEMTRLLPQITTRSPSDDAPSQSPEDHDLYARTNLTKHQLLIWLGQKLRPEVPLYNLGVLFNIPVEVDPARFQRAFQFLVGQSDALRTVIEEIDGVPQRRVVDNDCCRMEVLDFSSAADPAAALQIWISERLPRRFRMDQELVDTALIKLGQNKFVWYLNQHHIVSDGSSAKLIFDKTAELYQRCLKGQLESAELLPPFQKFVDHERLHRDSERSLGDLFYWKQKLSTNPGAIAFYGRTPLKTTTRVRRVSHLFSEEISQQLRSAGERVSSGSIDTALFNVFAAILCTWIFRCSHRHEFRLGIILQNRSLREFNETIGFCMQVFPIDIRIEDQDSFASLINKIRSEVQQCMRHSRCTLENPRHAPNYDILVNYHRDYTFQFDGSPATYEWKHCGHGDESVAFQVSTGNHTKRFRIDCDFHCDVFTMEQQAQALQHLLCAVDAFLSNGNQALLDVCLLTEAEERQVVLEFNQTDTAFPPAQSISRLFEAQVTKTPTRLAVVCGDRSLTYSQLNDRANRLANQLLRLGVGPEVVVALALGRGIDLLAAILAVFKAGGAYLPLDISWPQQRLCQVLAGRQSSLLLVDAGFKSASALPLEQELGTSCPRIECLESLLTQHQPENGQPPWAPNHLAYVIYTSGSTGVPKGAMVQHGGMLNHLRAKIKDLQLTSSDVVAQTASQCFDISVWQFLAALVVGAQVNILTDAVTHDPIRLLQTVQHEGITVLEVVPSLLAAMLDSLPGGNAETLDLQALRWLISTGEGLPTRLAQRWLRNFPRIPLCNAYGPTECSDDVSHYFMYSTGPSAGSAMVPVGRPIANTRLYILDDQLDPLAIGAVGELYVEGEGVGRGYLGNPERTAEFFVPNPFAQEPGSRLYRTGDLACYQSSGNIEILGRIDHQVKIRGFRIELGEVEAALAMHPTLRAAVVVDREGAGGQRYLAAYMVPKPDQAPVVGEIRAFLEKRLPDAMVPRMFVTLSTLPLTANGKVDRGALPTPDNARSEAHEGFVSPRDDWERRLTQVWEEILEVQPVGVTDSFFDLGGHSLLAVRLMFQVHKMSGRQLPLALLFERPTIEQLAQVLRQEIPVSSSSLVPIQSSGSKPPLFFVHAHGGGSIAYYPLAQYLGRDQPFYGLEAPGLDGQREPMVEIPAMASHYLEELRRVQPDGPYLLGGHSFGGLVAFEMAQQLSLQGAEVALLAILDTAAPVTGNTPFETESFLASADDATAFVQMAGLIERVVHKDMGVSREELSRMDHDAQVHYFLQKLKSVNFVSPDAGTSLIRGFLGVHRASSRASWSYLSQTKVYPGTMTLFLSRDVDASDFRAQDRQLRDDPALGWGDLVAGMVETHVVPGDHISMLTSPHVQILADLLASCIEKATSNAGKELIHA